ncbi:MAG TPA: hypothetical protein VF682_26115 [Pseudomonas sp.]|jgi:hypothetical protein
MSAINQQRVTVVLKPRPDEDLSAALSFLTLGSTVQIGRAGAVVASIGEGDQLQEIELLRNQIALAEAAMRRGALMADQDHIPALNRVIGHIMQVALNVADEVKETYLEEDNDEQEAEDRAGQALRVAAMIKMGLEKMLEPDLLSVETAQVNQIAQNLENVNQLQNELQNIPKTIPSSLITENPVVAESVHIDDRVKAVVAEPSFLTIVFKLPTLNAAAPLIAKLPYGQKALGTNAEVFGLTTGNLMESMQ